MNAGSGPPCLMAWADCALDGWLLRTLRGLLPGFPPSSIDWPASGTWGPGGWSPLPTSAPPTDGSGFLYLPTPMARHSGTSPEAFLARKNRDGGSRAEMTDLEVLVTGCWLPTPTAADGRGGRGYSPEGENLRDHSGLSLTDWALLPTPTAHDAGRGPGQRLMGKRAGPSLAELADYVGRSSPGSPTAPSATTGPPSDDMRLF